MNMSNYYWGPEDTSVHFCEDKYTSHPKIAEYYNTISSLYYIAIGCLFLSTKIAHLGKSLIVVGIGAFFLHMTLRYYAQMLDESAMLVISFDAVRHVRKNSFSRWFLAPLLLLYVIFHNYFLYFFVVFSAFQIYMAHVGLQIARPRSYQKLFIIGYIVLFSVGTACWLADQLLCEHVKDYQMHAWWHIFTSLAIASGFLVFLV